MSESSSFGRIVVLTAPSGAGKTTIARRMLEAIPEMRFSVSVTTRAPRSGERNGVDYHFLSEEAFWQREKEGDLLEYVEVYKGFYYGTLCSTVEAAAREAPVLLDIDVIGALNVQQKYGSQALTLFIAPPSMEVLEERLKSRATESAEKRAERLERAQMEMRVADQFNAIVVNDDLETAVAETLAHITRFLKSV